MKKILLSSILCFILSGCTVNYNLKIEDNKFSETIKGNVLNEEIKINEENKEQNYTNYFITKDQPVLTNNNNLLYKKTLSKNNNSIDYIYSYTHNEDSFKNSRILNECFEKFNFNNENNTYRITASGKFYCDYTDTININITTNYNVLIHNAKEVKNNTYSWTIDKNNKDNIDLYISVDKLNRQEKLELKWNIFKLTSLIVLLILSGTIILIIKLREIIKKKRS